MHRYATRQSEYNISLNVFQNISQMHNVKGERQGSLLAWQTEISLDGDEEQ